MFTFQSVLALLIAANVAGVALAQEACEVDFAVIDTVRNVEFGPLTPDLELPDGQYTFEAIPNIACAPFDSVVIDLRGPLSSTIGGAGPRFFSFGSLNGSPNGVTIPDGSYTIAADVRRGDDSIALDTFDFEVNGEEEVEETPVECDIDFIVLDNENNVDIGPLGSVLCIPDTPFTIEARPTVSCPFTTTAITDLNGPTSARVFNRSPPFTAFGTSFFTGVRDLRLSPGDYTFQADLFAQVLRDEVASKTVSFTAQECDGNNGGGIFVPVPAPPAPATTVPPPPAITTTATDSFPVEDDDNEAFDPNECNIGFVLFNADTNTEVGPLEDVVDVDFEVNIRAVPQGNCPTINSARLAMSGRLTTLFVGGRDPFFFFGGSLSDVRGRTLRDGDYTLTADFFTEGAAQGEKVASRTFEFTVGASQRMLRGRND